MLISEIQALLESLKQKHGDIETAHMSEPNRWTITSDHYFNVPFEYAEEIEVFEYGQHESIGKKNVLLIA